MNIMGTKSLSVLGNDGAGKKALIGSLIYKVGAILSNRGSSIC
jgi:translation elongation factor EF-1alpha